MIATNALTHDDKRQYPRRSVLWGGKIYSNGRLYDCTVWNISLGGAKVRVLPSLPHGAPVTLVVERFGEIQAHIVWSGDKAVGLQFLLPDDQVERILGQSVLKLGLRGAAGKSPIRPGSKGVFRR